VEELLVVHHRAANRVRSLARLVDEHRDRAGEVPVVEPAVDHDLTRRRDDVDLRMVRLVDDRDVGPGGPAARQQRDEQGGGQNAGRATAGHGKPSEGRFASHREPRRTAP
ncbi:MAG: hypothetical protein ACK559_08035, partial [bacterium]